MAGCDRRFPTSPHRVARNLCIYLKVTAVKISILKFLNNGLLCKKGLGTFVSMVHSKKRSKTHLSDADGFFRTENGIIMI